MRNTTKNRRGKLIKKLISDLIWAKIHDPKRVQDIQKTIDELEEL